MRRWRGHLGCHRLTHEIAPQNSGMGYLQIDVDRVEHAKHAGSDDGDDLYVSTGYYTGKVWVIDPPERRIEHVFNTGGVPRRMVVDHSREGAIVANEDGFVDIIR